MVHKGAIANPRMNSASQPPAPRPPTAQPFLSFLTGWVAGAGGVGAAAGAASAVLAAGGAAAAGVSAWPATMSISGTSCRTIIPSLVLPRGTNARSRAATGPFAICCEPPGGPPQRPRTGLAHAIGPVHSWRIA
jgi:hypothetical protein